MTMLARSFYKQSGHGPRNGNGNANANSNFNSNFNSNSNSNTYTNTNNRGNNQNGNPNYKGKNFNPNYRGKNFNPHHANIERANVNTPYKVKKFNPRNGNGQWSNGNANANANGNYKGKNYNPNYRGKNFNRHAHNPNIDIEMTEAPSDEPNDIEMPDAPPLPDPRIEAFAMGALAVKEIVSPSHFQPNPLAFHQPAVIPPPFYQSSFDHPTFRRPAFRPPTFHPPAVHPKIIKTMLRLASELDPGYPQDLWVPQTGYKPSVTGDYPPEQGTEDSIDRQHTTRISSGPGVDGTCNNCPVHMEDQTQVREKSRWRKEPSTEQGKRNLSTDLRTSPKTSGFLKPGTNRL
ncbi:hypothetical protein E8E15_008519 [Penicillium rubens]|nr:hypothetical protein E8E15_008519 [Penicillium rubens]